jgi:sugar lactone lactonase YvrE
VAAAAVAVFVTGPAQGQGPAYDPGDIIVADSGHDAIKAVDPVSGVATPVSSGGSFVFPADVTFASDGDALVVDRDAFGGEPNGGIIRVDSNTAAQTTVSNNHISSEAGGKKLFGNPIALDRKGGSLYVVDFHKPHKMFKVDIDTGKASLVTEARGLPSPSDVLAAGVAKPLVAATGPDVTELLEVNPKSGKQSVVSKNGKFEFPSGLIPDGSKSVLVTDPGPSAIFKVNLDNGNQKTLVEGPPLTSPIGIARIDSHTVAVSDVAAPSFPTGGIYRVDLDTGDQTLLNGSDFSNPLGIDTAP